MKQLTTIVAIVILVFMFLTPIFAGDVEDLQKLQPLNSLEQSIYAKVKNNATELHKFIVTRMYIRTLKEKFKTDDLESIFANKAEYLQKNVLNKYPVPDDFWPDYADNIYQGLNIFNAKLLQ